MKAMVSTIRPLSSAPGGSWLGVSPGREFMLAAACCRWPPSEARNLAIQDAAAAGIDWQRLVGVARRHRVGGLIHDGLKRAQVNPPLEVSERFRESALGIVRTNLEF